MNTKLEKKLSTNQIFKRKFKKKYFKTYETDNPRHKNKQADNITLGQILQRLENTNAHHIYDISSFWQATYEAKKKYDSPQKGRSGLFFRK